MTGTIWRVEDGVATVLAENLGLSARPDGRFVYVADGSRGDAVPYHRVRMIEIH